jgi:hypothetical protein
MRRTVSIVSLGVLFLLVSSACAKPYGSRHWPQSRERRPQLVFEPQADLSNADFFWNAPWPADARTLPTGAPDVRGLPNPFGVGFVDIAKRSVMEDVASRGVGFSPLPVVSFRFDRPVLPIKVWPLATLQADAGIMLVDLTPGRVGERVAVDVHVSQKRDITRPESLLQMAPLTGLSLLPGTWAAIVRRDVDADGDADLDVSPALQALLEGVHPDVLWSRSFQPLRARLDELGLSSSDIAAATVFTVGDPTARTVSFIQQARHDDPPRLVSIERGRAEVNQKGSVVEIRGVVAQPQHQTGEPPHFSETGIIVTDDAGRLQVTRTEDAPFVITLPRGAMPKDGFPLLLYVHGTGGSATQAIDRGRRDRPGGVTIPGTGIGSWIAADGVATACVAGPYSPDRIGDRALDGYGAYVFMNPPAMRDNFAQMLIEHARFVRLLETMSIDPALAPEVDASASVDGRIRFDVKHFLVGGHSLGSFLSGMLAGSLDDFQGAILSGAGGTWVEFAFGPKDPVDLQGLIETVALPPGEDLDRFHPFIDIFETGVAGADNTLYTRHILKHPRPGFHAPHVLVIEGQPDAQVPTGLQRALVRSVGVDFVGTDVGARSIDRLLPALHSIGKAALTSPVVDNIDVPGVGPRTGVVVRFAEDGPLDGHSVIFQRPDTRAVFVRFVREVARGQTPVVDLR